MIGKVTKKYSATVEYPKDISMNTRITAEVGGKIMLNGRPVNLGDVDRLIEAIGEAKSFALGYFH